MSKAKTYCKAYGIPLIIAFYLLLLAEAPNTVSVTSQNPHPNEVLNELNGYASLGWTFKSAIPYLDGHMMLIFERED